MPQHDTTIAEAFAAKREAEQQIMQALTDFHAKTGLTVRGVVLESFMTFGLESPYLASVDLEIPLK